MHNYYKIYRYREPHQLPTALDIHPGSIIFPEQLNKNLPKEPTIYLGERRQTIYYDRYEDEVATPGVSPGARERRKAYIDPIIKIAYAFKRDDAGLVYEKIRTIVWCLESGKWSSQTQQDSIPIINEAVKLQEIKRRRSNIIDELKGLAKKFSTKEIPLEAKILEVFEDNQLLINSYIDAGSAKFRNAIANSEAAWLDTVIPATGNKSRDILVSYLSIGLS